jgi:RNA polymerase sigma-54 factor
VKGLIQSLIASEDPENPYSDEELVNILKEKGVTVARRTVAKYRDMLNIPASGKRKKINMIKS